MSEKDQNPDGNAEGGQDDVKTDSDNSAWEQEKQKLLAKNKELLGKLQDVKTLKSEYETLKAEKEKADEEKLKADGKLDELLQKEKQRNADLAMKFKNKIMDTQIEKALIEAGCEFPKEFMSVVGGYAESVKFDDDYNADSETIKAWIEQGKSNKAASRFFETQAAPPKDGGHGGSQDDKQEKKGIRSALEAIY